MGPRANILTHLLLLLILLVWGGIGAWSGERAQPLALFYYFAIWAYSFNLVSSYLGVKSHIVIARLCLLILSLWPIAVMCLHLDPGNSRQAFEMDQVFLFSLGVLAVPAAIFGELLVQLPAMLFGGGLLDVVYNRTSLLGLFVFEVLRYYLWLYLQWFVLIPHLMANTRGKNERTEIAFEPKRV